MPRFVDDLPQMPADCVNMTIMSGIEMLERLAFAAALSASCGGVQAHGVAPPVSSYLAPKPAPARPGPAHSTPENPEPESGLTPEEPQSVVRSSDDDAAPRGDSAAGEPHAEARDCPSSDRRRFATFADGDRLFGGVKKGWTVAAVQRRLGDPSSCNGDVWYYSAGSPDGPLVTYSFTMKAGKVANIERSAAACIYRESTE